MRHLAQAHPEGTNLELVGTVVFVQLERVLDELLVPPAADDPAETIRGAGRCPQLRAGGIERPGPAGDRHGLLARRVGERVAERDEVEDVVGVQVADQHRVDVHVIAEAPELREHPVAAIEQQHEVVLLHQVSAAGPADVLPGR